MLLCGVGVAGVVQAAPVGVPVAAVLPGPAAQAPASTPALVPYTVRPGDNLFRLASRYLIRADDYRVVQKLNHVADPLRLPVGMTLLFPRELLRHEPVRAIVQSSRGTVTIDGRPAGVGAVVDEGMLVTTGDKSFVTLVLPDATSIALPSQSAVRVQRMRRVVLDTHVERLFSIEYGHATAHVTPMTDPRSTFQFATPGAVTSVRGTRFRMAYDKSDGLATSEVLEGKVGFDVEDHAAQSLPAGYGSTSRLDHPVELLDPPGWRDVGAVQDGQGLHFSWAPMAGARAYHVQIAADEAFVRVLDETVTSQSEADLGSQPNGAYFARVTAIDGNGLEGRPAVQGFSRDRIGLRLWTETDWAPTTAGPSVQHTRFRWRVDDPRGVRYRFQLVRKGKEGRPLLDRDGLTIPMVEGYALPSGRYRWRVMVERAGQASGAGQASQAGGAWSAYEELRIKGGGW